MTHPEGTTALAESRSTVLVFEEYPRPPLRANDLPTWRVKAALTRRLRAATSWKAREAGIPALGRCRVTLTWYVKDRIRRDADNVWPTLKPMCDGLVDAGIVPDDIPELMDKLTPRIVYEKGCTPRLELLVEQVTS